MAEATVSDIKEVITTGLSDSDITDSINYAQELNELFYDTTNQTTTETKNIERWGAIINIRQHKERSVEEDSAGDSSATYEGSELKMAKAELSRWEPGNQIATSLIQDTNRFSGTVTPNK
jgi:hypothetical protein